MVATRSNLVRIARRLYRRARSFTSLQFATIAFVFLVCICVVGLQALNIRSERARDIDAASGRAADLARALGQQAEDTFRLADTALIGSVTRLEDDGYTDKTLNGLRPILIARVKVFHSLVNFVITDETGKCLVVEPGPASANCSLVGRGNFEYHRTHTDKAPRLGRPRRGLISGTWIMSLSRRVNHPDGSFAGIVSVGLSLPFFQDYYDTFDIGPKGAIVLARNGEDPVILIRRPFIEANVGRDFRNAAIFKVIAARGPIGQVELKASTDGEERLYAYRQLNAFPLLIAVGFGMDDILADWRASARIQMVTTAGLVLLIAALGAWLSLHIRTRRRLEDAHRDAAAAFRLLAENSTDLIVRLGPDNERIYVSPACRALFGYEPEEMLGHNPLEMVHPDDRERWKKDYGPADGGADMDVTGTYRLIRKDGSVIWVEGNRRRLAAEGGFVVTIRDVTQRKVAEEKLAELNARLQSMANHDALTGLANRRQFDDTLETEFRRAARGHTTLSLIMIDVDRFKRFNDRFGHPAGDGCLKQIAGALAGVIRRPGDLLARYGGEEMAIVLPNTPLAGALNIAEHARQAVRALAIPHADIGKMVTISLGVAASCEAIDRPAKLIEAADKALYVAKESGRDAVRSASDEPADQAAD